ncbi:MAG: DUF4446 family protein [Candidatus Pacebacteria bacterium]|jgi:hypothetical protein|nr:hypothetical protein [bacterium]MDP6527833.1 DUF4446 family protein [Candidatus Paceibacterota bacterium]MDP6659812.1 DUF4446 family protein [Candidatus Paceibacterota bacterium]|tara:strand:- start:3083 stop:3565 length:483 start_codon:yes stop_codon:yes gene_type:complete
MPEFPNIDTEILIYVTLGIFALLLLWFVRIETKLRRFTRGSDGKNLEGAVRELSGGQKELEKFKAEMEKYLTNVEKRLQKSVRGISTIRFNPFKGMGAGGNQSFSTAFLNEDGEGVVLSTLYARDRVSMYAKAVENFSSTHELTKEEKEAIEEARTRLQS